MTFPPAGKTTPTPAAEPPIEPPPETAKTPTSEPGEKQATEPASNRAELPRYALAFSGPARVELQNTAVLFDLLRAYTVEVWVRPTSGQTQSIVGNHILGKLHLADRTQAAVAAYELGLVRPGGG